MSHPANETRKILIVDDDPATREALARMIGMSGVQAFTAGNVLEAKALLAEKPESIVVDLGLPGERGESLIEFIQAAHLDTKIIVLTGADEEHVVGAWKLGVSIVTKPANLHKLTYLLNI